MTDWSQFVPDAPFLKRDLELARARELVAELGFLGIVDLVQLMAAAMDGTIKCDGPRVVVWIKKRPRLKKVLAKASSAG